jgi:hypothetical protein
VELTHGVKVLLPAFAGHEFFNAHLQLTQKTLDLSVSFRALLVNSSFLLRGGSTCTQRRLDTGKRSRLRCASGVSLLTDGSPLAVFVRDLRGNEIRHDRNS